MATAEAPAPAIGIDLGTTHSCVAVFHNGSVEIFPNDMGERITPSYVAFTNNDILVGSAAKNQLAMNPTNTIYNFKRLMGRGCNDIEDTKQYPFHVVVSDSNLKIEVIHKHEKKEFCPEQISALVLMKMKETAEARLNMEIKQAVITVPAYFNDAQRQATKDAGAIAGLEVLRIVNEPTAAAFAYGLYNKVDSSNRKINVLVFDLGGGTFDVTILTICNGVYDVKSTGGNSRLGGVDFDDSLVKHFIREIMHKFRVDIKNDKRAVCRLRSACEVAKKHLSSSTEATIELDALFDGTNFQSTITRARFELLNNDLFKATMDTVDQVVIKSKLNKSAIDEVILAGGSTRIPKIHKLLQDFFDGKELNKSINGDEAIAYGAAIQAAILNRDKAEHLSKILLLDVTSWSLGIAIKGGIMDRLIKKNSTIPTPPIVRTYQTVKDSQDAVNIRVFEGEHTTAEDNSFLGEVYLSLTPAPKGAAKIIVTFSVNENGILTVNALEKWTDNENQIEIIINKNSLSQETIERMANEVDGYRAEKASLKESLLAKNELEAYCFNMIGYLDAGNTTLSDAQEASLLFQRCNDTIDWLDVNQRATKEEYKTRLNALKVVFEAHNPILCDPVVPAPAKRIKHESEESTD